MCMSVHHSRMGYIWYVCNATVYALEQYPLYTCGLKITNTPSTNELRNESVWILVIWRWSRISGLCGLVVRTFVTRIDTRLRGYGGRGFESRQWPNFSHIFKVLFVESNLELNISKFILNFQIYKVTKPSHLKYSIISLLFTW